MTYTATSQLGIYKVELLANTEVQTEGWFAVNLFAPDESYIAPAESIMVGQTEVTQARSGEEYGQRELWPWLAVAALAVLLIEWWVYHRGSALPVRSRPQMVRRAQR